jgi:hypothetical protein
MFAANIVAERVPTEISAGASISIPLRVRNTGDQSWLASGPRPVRAAFHWLDVDGRPVVYGGRRTPLPGDVSAGDEAGLELTVDAPERTGAHVLRITLVQEGVAWFDERGMTPVDVPIVITA